MGSSAGERADLNGFWCTETIKASGLVTPRKQAGHMTAPDQPIASNKHLANHRPSTHDPVPENYWREYRPRPNAWNGNAENRV